MFRGQSFHGQNAFHCTAQHKSFDSSLCSLRLSEAMQANADGASQFPHVPPCFIKLLNRGLSCCSNMTFNYSYYAYLASIYC